MLVSSPPRSFSHWQPHCREGGTAKGKTEGQGRAPRPEVCMRQLVLQEIKEPLGCVMEGLEDMQRPGLALRSLDIKKESDILCSFL